LLDRAIEDAAEAHPPAHAEEAAEDARVARAGAVVGLHLELDVEARLRVRHPHGLGAAGGRPAPPQVRRARAQRPELPAVLGPGGSVPRARRRREREGDGDRCDRDRAAHAQNLTPPSTRAPSASGTSGRTTSSVAAPERKKRLPMWTSAPSSISAKKRSPSPEP